MPTTSDSSLALSFGLSDEWPTNVCISDQNHNETIRQMDTQLSQQTREAPWYGFLVGTIMPHLRAIYSSTFNGLQLEAYPQFELIYDTDYAREQLDEAKDPSWTLAHGRAFSTPAAGAPAGQTSEPKKRSSETDRLLISGLDGRRWAGPKREGTRSRRKAAQATVAGSNEPDPEFENLSVTTASTAPEDISVRTIRVTDAMFLMRASLAAYQDLFPDAREVPAFPAIAFELKVPKYKQLVDLEITDIIAGGVFKAAMPQIVQQAQFVFHNWPTLCTFYITARNPDTELFDQHLLVQDERVADAVEIICNELNYSRIDTAGDVGWADYKIYNSARPFAFEGTPTTLLQHNDLNFAYDTLEPERILVHAASTFQFPLADLSRSCLNPAPPSPESAEVRFPMVPAFYDSLLDMIFEPPLGYVHFRSHQLFRTFLAYLTTYNVSDEGITKASVPPGEFELIPSCLRVLDEVKDENKPYLARFFLKMKVEREVLSLERLLIRQAR
ncbi:hypothetical protein EYR40_011076 [Pleurotus pulmonarius]|nr:hypothetical protein EYR36_002844 [Pleurotus pulmonarius]KAF4587055.1 hypothetical protein EYR40_011076 [Pleurotus pulmonarius]